MCSSLNKQVFLDWIAMHFDVEKLHRKYYLSEYSRFYVRFNLFLYLEYRTKKQVDPSFTLKSISVKSVKN
jgi:hypothetical protein